MRKKNLPSGVYLHTDGVDMTGRADYSMLTKLTMMSNHIEQQDSEYDSDDDYQEELMKNEMDKIKRRTLKREREIAKKQEPERARSPPPLGGQSSPITDLSSPKHAEVSTIRFRKAANAIVNSVRVTKKSVVQHNRRAQKAIKPQEANELHKSIMRNQELNNKWMHCDDILSPACKIVHQKCKNVGRTELQDLLFRQVETLLLSRESTFTILESKGGYGKSSIANVVLALAKRVRITHVRVQTDENSMHDPWAVWKPVVRFLLGASGIDKEDGILQVLDLLPLKEEEKARAVIWLHDIIPEQWCQASTLKRRANGSAIQTVDSVVRKTRKGEN